METQALTLTMTLTWLDYDLKPNHNLTITLSDSRRHAPRKHSATKKTAEVGSQMDNKAGAWNLEQNQCWDTPECVWVWNASLPRRPGLSLMAFPGEQF